MGWRGRLPPAKWSRNPKGKTVSGSIRPQLVHNFLLVFTPRLHMRSPVELWLLRIQGGVMNRKRIGAYLILCSLVVTVRPFEGLAQQNSDASKTSIQQTSTERDGQHDFDPLIGSWKYHLKRRLHPLTGSNTRGEFDGTGVCRKVWAGAPLHHV